MSFKNKNIVRQFPFFSHFMCLPLIDKNVQQLIIKTQQLIENKLRVKGLRVEQRLKRHSHLLSHLTLFMLTLKRQQTKDKLSQVLKQEHKEIIKRLQNMQLQLRSVRYFTRVNKNQKCNELTVIYLEIDKKSQQVLQSLIDYLAKILLKNEIIVVEELKPMRINYNHNKGKFQLQTFHVSLFRCKGLMEKNQMVKLFEQVNQQLWNSKKSNNNDKNNNVALLESIIQDKKETCQQQNKKQQHEQLDKQVINDSTRIKINCHSLDISTMMAFDQSQFYQPLIRLQIKCDQQKQTNINQSSVQNDIKSKDNK